MNRAVAIGTMAALAILLLGASYLWAVRGTAILLDFSWVGCL